MEERTHWLDRVYALAKEDPWCQECREKLEASELAFIRLMNRLEPSDRDTLDRYVSACEELQFSLVSLAYEAGNQKKGGSA